jgi:hypothetical protein
MIHGDFSHAKRYKHIGSGFVYVFVGLCRYKFKDSWYVSVLYASVEDTEQVYGRTVQNFRDKFEEV